MKRFAVHYAAALIAAFLLVVLAACGGTDDAFAGSGGGTGTLSGFVQVSNSASMAAGMHISDAGITVDSAADGSLTLPAVPAGYSVVEKVKRAGFARCATAS